MSSPFAELKVRHKKPHYQYNHTLATILVEYASAVSFMGILYVQPLRCVGKWFRIVYVYYLFSNLINHGIEGLAMELKG